MSLVIIMGDNCSVAHPHFWQRYVAGWLLNVICQDSPQLGHRALSLLVSNMYFRLPPAPPAIEVAGKHTSSVARLDQFAWFNIFYMPDRGPV